MTRQTKRLLGSRSLIGLVVFFNLHCALTFLIRPWLYAPGFELDGIPGEVMVRGMGILFIMWNIPYLFALVSPVKNRRSLTEAIWMQTIGLVGETSLLISLPAGHEALRETALRFILFDGGGLLALLLAAWLVRFQLTNSTGKDSLST